MFLTLCHTWDSNLQYSYPESIWRVVTSGGDLLDDHPNDLLTPCDGILGCRAFTIYMKMAPNSASWLYYILLVLGRKRQDCSLETITSEARPFLKRYVMIPFTDWARDAHSVFLKETKNVHYVPGL